MKSFFGKIAKNTFNSVGLTLFRELPRGIDQWRDIREAFPSLENTMIFDIGANVGQSAQRLQAMFPKSNIHCFEPSAETFQILNDKFCDQANFQCHNMALGAESRNAKLHKSENSTMRHVMLSECESIEGSETEAIRIDTLDSFCGQNNIERIDILKIDTEGHDGEVIRGAQKMFGQSRIHIVQCELGVHPANKNHVPLSEMVEKMHTFGFDIFGFYSQKPRETMALRRVDTVFVSRSILAKYPRI